MKMLSFSDISVFVLSCCTNEAYKSIDNFELCGNAFITVLYAALESLNGERWHIECILLQMCKFWIQA